LTPYFNLNTIQYPYQIGNILIIDQRHMLGFGLNYSHILHIRWFSTYNVVFNYISTFKLFMLMISKLDYTLKLIFDITLA
jgi:hypothetical protein